MVCLIILAPTWKENNFSFNFTTLAESKEIDDNQLNEGGRGEKKYSLPFSLSLPHTSFLDS